VPNALEIATPGHYSTTGERLADQWIHLVGLAGAIIGAPILVTLALLQGGLGRASAALVYAVCLLTMLALSMAYNLAKRPALQRRLRRLDHAAIFLMIAGSYTPFTTQRLDRTWALGLTISVWSIALLAAAGKLFLPGLAKRLWIPVYVLLGWMAVGAIGPFIAGVSPVALILLAIGGVIYSLGVLIYLSPKLPFRRALWHGFVVAAAAAHYAAVMTGVVLT
jgi:hemolysin III